MARTGPRLLRGQDQRGADARDCGQGRPAVRGAVLPRRMAARAPAGRPGANRVPASVSELPDVVPRVQHRTSGIAPADSLAAAGAPVRPTRAVTRPALVF